MPIYMDLHIVPGITAHGAAEAHRQDLLIQRDYNCNCMTYWVDETKDSAFCLIDAPNPEAVKELHDKAHGLMIHQIIEVNSTVVESFLGRIYDPELSQISEGELKVFNDPAFRVLVIIKCYDIGLLSHKLGKIKVEELLARFRASVQLESAAYEGREVEYHTDTRIISFTSAFKAVAFSLAIYKLLSEEEKITLSPQISINAGMPVTMNSILFGDAIQLGERLFYTARSNQIVVASIIREITHKNYFDQKNRQIVYMSPSDEKSLDQLIDILEEKSGDSDFSASEFCQLISLSKSGLYRISQALTGRSPNRLIKEYRLQKALKLMKVCEKNISETAFDAGFSSPAYFSKCFLETFGILPSTYKNIL